MTTAYQENEEDGQITNPNPPHPTPNTAVFILEGRLTDHPDIA